MTLYETIPLTFEEKHYEIRVLYDDNIINVVAFHNNHPANGFRHQIKLPKRCDARTLLEKGAAKDLIEISGSDIAEKRGHQLSELIAESRDKGV